jgi:hypothetical protein
MMSLDEMISEIRARSGFPVKIICYAPGYFTLVGAMDFAVSLLEGGV